LTQLFIEAVTQPTLNLLANTTKIPVRQLYNTHHLSVAIHFQSLD